MIEGRVYYEGVFCSSVSIVRGRWWRLYNEIMTCRARSASHQLATLHLSLQLMACESHHLLLSFPLISPFRYVIFRLSFPPSFLSCFLLSAKMRQGHSTSRFVDHRAFWEEYDIIYPEMVGRMMVFALSYVNGTPEVLFLFALLCWCADTSPPRKRSGDIPWSAGKNEEAYFTGRI